MSTLGCAEVRDAAPEFALGVLDGEQRSEVLLHLDQCSACQHHVAELSETADALVLLAPEAEPPPGFERRVHAQLDDSVRRRRWRTLKLIAATAAAAAILSVVTVRVIDEARSPSSEADAPIAAQTVAMTDDDGQKVGHVDVGGRPSALALNLSVYYDGLPDGPYRVVLDPHDGAKRPLGNIQVDASHGSWFGTAHVDGRAALALVDTGGHTRCSAELPST
jgi:hypothetical protein